MGESGFETRAQRVSTTQSAETNTRSETRSRATRVPIVLQTKLTVGASDDPYEREADEIADRVTSILREGATSTVERTVRTPLVGRISRLATIGSAGGDLDADTESQITRARTGGKPLETGIKRSMESAFGADFSNIRMHVGPTSDALNNKIQARAFTTGSDVFVRREDYSPNTASGQKLLAHELAHTVQQGGATALADGGAQRCLQRSSQTIQRWGEATTDAAAKGRAKGSLLDDDDDSNDGLYESGEMVAASLNSNQVNDIDDYKDDIAKAQTGDKDAVGTGKSGASEQQGQQLGVVGGVADFAAMFVGLAKSVSSFRTAKAEGKWADQVGAVLEGAAAVTSGAKGMAGIVKSGSELDGHKDGIGDSDAASTSLGGIADSFGAVKDTFFAVKKIVELASTASTLTNEEKFNASMDIIKTALEAAKGGVSAVKSFLDVCDSGVNVAMVNAVPGLGIAIGCAEMVIRSVDLIQSLVRSSEMKTAKRDMKTKMGGKKGTSMKAEAQKTLASATATKFQKDAAAEYLTAKGLQSINDKRTNRALLKMSVAMAKIAGDAATLGGASAPVGIGLKVAAIVVDLGATAVRKFKQWARNKAADQEAAGKAGVLSKVFDSKKSSTNKLIEYNRILDNVFTMIVEASPSGPVTLKHAAQMHKVERYVEAMGFSLFQMEREAARDTDGTNLRTMMVKAMQERE